MDTTTNVLMLLAWFFLTASVLGWLMTRANAQIKRFKDEPTPEARVKKINSEVLGILDTLVDHNRRITANVMTCEDLLSRIISLGNRMAAQKRRDAQVDLDKFADYIQQLETDGQDESEKPEAAPSTLAQTADGQVVDFR